ncbi:lysine N(6)-hydroxylase/L-ornithine N(5)-oxygenase family protein [Enterovibrio sp. 27052020O]|uniref:lysine N(6)-hydroxylase/L-ornithine N(5)-oxygenase family protein n=1 Tax=Enterovibrio sp. 27052020O TaxID=3241166 RepID=UPI00388F8FBA
MNTQIHAPILDLAGIGAGPFNLSVAALLQEKPELNTCFFESREALSWHPGLLLDGTHMQTMFLKDLVTAVSPQSDYSFLAYLVEKKRFYRFLSAEMNCISRHEFSDYLNWASRKLPNLRFSTRVERIEFIDNLFHIYTNQGIWRARNLCLGTGKSPYIPQCAQPYIGDRVFHAAEVALRQRDLTGKRVAIIGGGQSGADIFLNALREQWGKPAQLDWISRRANYQPLDEAAFTNEFFTPDYVSAFVSLSPDVRGREVAAQKLTSDGITQQALLEIYRELYQRFDVTGERKWVRLLPHRTLVSMLEDKGAYKLTATNSLTQASEISTPDIVILATGFESAIPTCIDGLRHQLDLDAQGRFSLNKHFEMNWAHASTHKIFAVNAGIHSHGIAEPQLSLMAWRSACIINHLCNENVFDTDCDCGLIDWASPVSRAEAMA